MQIKDLSSNEKIIIKRIAQIQIESFTRLGDKRSPIFEEVKEESKEFYEKPITDFDIDLQLTDEILEFEKVLKEPEYLFKLDKLNLMVAEFIVASGVSSEKFPKTKASLLKKLSLAQEVNNN